MTAAAAAGAAGNGENKLAVSILGALEFLDPADASVRAEVGAQLKGLPGGGVYMSELWWSWSKRVHLSRATADAEWAAISPGSDGIGLVLEIASAKGWSGGISEDVLPPAYSEERLAAEFTTRFGSDWRFVAAWGTWMCWRGGRWFAEKTLQAFDLARAVARDAAAKAADDASLREGERRRAATIIASSRTVTAIERLARADRVHAMQADDWDKDPWLLNTPAGVVDLRTGIIAPHERARFMTKITRAAPGGACPIWQAFLRRVTGGDRELEAFLQRFAGYTLTGSTREHALLFLYGLGGNGKTTFVATLQGLLGDYATSAPMETFVESHGERHPTDLAMLRGARLVVASEVEDGQRWAVSRMKQLTGGDTIRARFMRQDYFEYAPQFKLILGGNHKPSFRQVDEAIRRRFHLVPFTQTIAAAERDKDLPEKLRDEWPGILAWAIAGCRQWQARGLAAPESVLAATQAYLEDEDVMRAWLNEACEVEPRAFTALSDLHASYQAWAEKAGERFAGRKRFGQALEDHGYQRERTSSTRGFRGLRIKPQGQARLVA